MQIAYLDPDPVTSAKQSPDAWVEAVQMLMPPIPPPEQMGGG